MTASTSFDTVVVGDQHQNPQGHLLALSIHSSASPETDEIVEANKLECAADSSDLTERSNAVSNVEEAVVPSNNTGNQTTVQDKIEEDTSASSSSVGSDSSSKTKETETESRSGALLETGEARSSNTGNMVAQEEYQEMEDSSASSVSFNNSSCQIKEIETETRSGTILETGEASSEAEKGFVDNTDATRVSFLLPSAVDETPQQTLHHANTATESNTIENGCADRPTNIVDITPNTDNSTTPETRPRIRPVDAMRFFRKMRSTGMILPEHSEIPVRPASHSDARDISTAITDNSVDGHTHSTESSSNTDEDMEGVEREQEQSDRVEPSSKKNRRATVPLPLPDSNNKTETELNSKSVDYSYSWGKTKIMVSNNNEKKTQICDSHTSYRRQLEQDVVSLKIQLAEAQERADSLQNDLNITTKTCLTDRQTLLTLQIEHAESKRLAEGLSTVVTHLQDNAKGCAAERSALYSKIEEYERERDIATRRSKHLRTENRRLRKQLDEGLRDLEGTRMEIQGLKSENDMLKKEIHSNYSRNQKEHNLQESNEDGSVSGNALDNLPVFAEIRQFLSPMRKLGSSGTLDSVYNVDDSDNNSSRRKFSISSNYDSQYTSFADIHGDCAVAHANAVSEVDSIAAAHDKDIVAALSLQKSSAGIGGPDPERRKMTGDNRRKHKTTSKGSRNFFNALAAKHIQGAMEDSEDDVSQGWNKSKPYRLGNRGSGNGYQCNNGNLSPPDEEDEHISTQKELPKRWQKVLNSKMQSSERRHVDDESSVSERSMTSPKWNWWWRESTSENKTPSQSSQEYQQQYQQQKQQQARTSTSWFFGSRTVDNDCVKSLPPAPSSNEANRLGKSVGVSVTERAIKALEDDSSGFTNTLVPRSLEHSVFM